MLRDLGSRVSGVLGHLGFRVSRGVEEFGVKALRV